MLVWAFIFAMSIVPQQTYALEVDIEDVHQWLHIKGLTRYDNLADFRANDRITRWEASKFITQYAKLLNMWTSYTECTFSDIANYDNTLTPFIAEVCSYGLIKWSQWRYMPTGNLTEAEAATIVVRSLEWFKDETKSPWYVDYYNRAKELQLINNETLESVNTTNITRGKLWTWLFLAYAWISIPDAGQEQDHSLLWVTMTITDADGNKTEVSGKAIIDGWEDEPLVKWYVDYEEKLLTDAITQWHQIVLFFNASRCPLCKTLHADLTNEETVIPENLVIFNVDYDSETALKEKFGIASQHTLVYLDKKWGELYKNVKQELSLLDIVTVISTANWK